MDTILENRTFNCQLLTPLFSYGAYSNKPEIRPSEIKGLMRYTYRIACATANHQALLKDEAALFGGAANANDEGHASPIRLNIEPQKYPDLEQQLLLHGNVEQGNKETYKFYPQPCLESIDFKLTLTLNHAINTGFAVNLNWYSDLLALSLLLGGLGKRSRKGRGSIAIQSVEPAADSDVNYHYSDKATLLKAIARMLNTVAATPHNHNAVNYTLDGKTIIANLPSNNTFHRPIITCIELGSCIPQDKLTAYLAAIDCACHHTKADYYKNYYDGWYKKTTTDKYLSHQKAIHKKPNDNDLLNILHQTIATGFASPRVASPLLISIVLIDGHCYPIYTFLHAIVNQNSQYNSYSCYDVQNNLRQEFIRFVGDLFANHPNYPDDYVCTKKGAKKS